MKKVSFPAVDLLKKMLNPIPESRPSSTDALSHPFLRNLTGIRMEDSILAANFVNLHAK